MAKQLTPAQMAAAFRKWQVDLNLYPGWEARGYGPGSISDVQGIVVHHTGSDAGQTDDYLNFLFVRGRATEGIPGPLCNWATDMDGDLWLGAAERANHAGMGSSSTLAKVKSGGYSWSTMEIAPGRDDVNGNTKYYGNEVRYDGGQPMTPAAYRTVILSCAAICDAHGWSAYRVIGHREHSGRKNDPGSAKMYLIRQDVAAALRVGPGKWNPGTPPTNDGGLTMADAASIEKQLGTIKTLIEGQATLYTGRWTQQMNEMKAQAVKQQELLNSLLAAHDADEADEDAFERLTGDRWAQAVREGREQAAAIVARIDALSTQTEPEPPAPKA